MNPLSQEAIASILRWGLAIGAGYLVKQGIWTEENAATYVAAAALGLIALGWGLYQKYASRLKLMVALALPKNSTEKQAEDVIKRGDAPPATLTKSERPHLETEWVSKKAGS